MSLPVSFFAACVSVGGFEMPIPAGDPLDVQTTSPITPVAGAKFMLLELNGTTPVVTWSNGKAETLYSSQFRGAPASNFTFA